MRFICGFGYDVSVTYYDWSADHTAEPKVLYLFYSVDCEVWLWVLDNEVCIIIFKLTDIITKSHNQKFTTHMIN